jgi:hypothetical protein
VDPKKRGAHLGEWGPRLRRAGGRAGNGGMRLHAACTAPPSASSTPGSRAGRPLSILKSAAPPAALRDDADLVRERAASTVTNLLGC